MDLFSAFLFSCCLVAAVGWGLPWALNRIRRSAVLPPPTVAGSTGIFKPMQVDAPPNRIYIHRVVMYGQPEALKMITSEPVDPEALVADKDGFVVISSDIHHCAYRINVEHVMWMDLNNLAERAR